VRQARGSVPSQRGLAASLLLSGAVSCLLQAVAGGAGRRKGILDFLTDRVHMSGDLTVKNRWSLDGMAERAKKFMSMAYRCERSF
jgi:hypothetical protein